MDTDYKSWSHSLKHVGRSIRFYMNSAQTQFMSFQQDGAISKLYARPLKLLDNTIYLGSNISSIESEINIRIGKAWAAIDRLFDHLISLIK